MSLVVGGSRGFAVVLLRFKVVYGCSWWFIVVCGGLWWFLVARGGSWWFTIVCGGSVLAVGG